MSFSFATIFSFATTYLSKWQYLTAWEVSWTLHTETQGHTHMQREPSFNNNIFTSIRQIMKCNSGLKHSFKGCYKKCNPVQGQFVDLIIFFYSNVDIFDCAFEFTDSITFIWENKDGILEISEETHSLQRGRFYLMKLSFKPKLLFGT